MPRPKAVQSHSELLLLSQDDAFIKEVVDDALEDDERKGDNKSLVVFSAMVEVVLAAATDIMMICFVF